MFPSIHGVVSQPFATVSNWWEAGGATGAIAVYQLKGAADLANSYTDLSGNLNHAAPGVAPTFSALTGWTFNGTTQYLTTGLAIAANSWSALVRFSDVTNDGWLLGSLEAGGYRFDIAPANSGTRVVFGNSGEIGAGRLLKIPQLTSGTLGIAGNAAYRNGAYDGTIPAFTAYTSTLYKLYIGALNSSGGGGGGFIAGKIQAIAIYNNTLSAAAVLAVSNAMAAL